MSNSNKWRAGSFIVVTIGLLIAAIALFVEAADRDQSRSVDRTTRLMNVQADFGAVGDGETDDTKAFQKALDSGRIVNVPPGRYMLNRIIHFSSGSGLTGSKDAVIVLNGDYRLQGDKVDHIEITGVTIERNMPMNTATEATIQLFYCHDIVLDSLHILNHRSLTPAILVRGSFVDTSDNTESYNIRITNNEIRDYQRIAPDGIGNKDNEGVKGSGISVAHSKFFTVSNNIVRETQRYFEPPQLMINFQGSGIEIISSIHGTVTGNVVDYAGQGIDIGGGHNMADAGGKLTTADGFRGSQYVSVTGNSVSDIYSAGIKLVNGASYNSITGNTIARSGLIGIWFGNGATAFEDQTRHIGNVVSGNTIIDMGSGPGEGAWIIPKAKRGTGITIEKAKSAKLRAESNIIAGNTIIDNHGRMTYGITDQGVFDDYIADVSAGNRFEGNVVRGAQTADYWISDKNTLVE